MIENNIQRFTKKKANEDISENKARCNRPKVLPPQKVRSTSLSFQVKCATPELVHTIYGRPAKLISSIL